MKNNFFVLLKDKKFRQGGVALVVTFFIMGIAVALVLGVSVLLLSELKMIRGIGDSVRAFYAADTGIEKTLYYDRKQIPSGGARGICDICDSCLDCDNCSTVGGSGCALETCADCEINYTTDLTNKMFRVTVTVSSGSDIYQSYGTYEGVTRAIELNSN